MNTRLLLALPLTTLFSSCIVTPPPPGPPVHYHGPHGREVVVHDRDPRSPWSPGGRIVLPREARRTVYRGNVYYVHRDVWYRPSGSTYVIVRRPY